MCGAHSPPKSRFRGGSAGGDAAARRALPGPGRRLGGRRAQPLAHVGPLGASLAVSLGLLVRLRTHMTSPRHLK